MSEEKHTDEQLATEQKPNLQAPSMYKVLLHNDDYTTMEFVVHILETIFHKNSEEANDIMMRVHNQGAGVCGIFTYEVAETKVAMVHEIAKQYEFPLRCSMEQA